MKTSTLLPWRLALAAFLLVGNGLAALAQTVAPTPSTPSATAGTCVPSTATSYSYTFTPAAGQTLTGWYVLGDLNITSGASPLANPVIVQSTGPGRGRIVAQYNAGASCPQIAYYTVNKTFSQPSNTQFLGPDCVELGVAYGFVVPPLVSTPALINAQIGIDIYDWDVTRGTYGSNAGFPSGSTVEYSGDHSAVALTLPTSFTGSSYELRVKIGTCNSAYMSKTVYIKPKKPILTVTSGNATCKTDLLPFTFSYTVEAGVKYTWNGIPTGWTISLPGSTPSGGGVTYASSGTQTATITPSNSTVADISVTASNSSGGSCASSPSDVFRVTRQLTTTDNPISPASPGCLTPGSSITFSFTHALPSNTIFSWDLPPTWTPTSATGNSITVTVGPGPGNVVARVAGCGTGGTVRAVTVSGNNGCLPSTYSIDRYGAQKKYFEVTNPTNPGCEQGTGTGISYEWWSTTNPTHVTTASNYVTFTNSEVIGNTVNVRIRNANTCLDVTVSNAVNRPATPTGTASVSQAEPLVAYPSPAGGELHVDLDLPRGTAQLLLVDMLGRTVQATQTGEAHTRLNVQRLPTGTYTLRAVLPDGKTVGKTIQVQH